jgi:NADH:ubiquinone oxidoreductase subunit E
MTSDLHNPPTVKTIEICMGSACFARGNAGHARRIRAFIVEENLETLVRLTGCHCKGQCLDGPRILLDGVVHTAMNPEKLVHLLKSLR